MDSKDITRLPEPRLDGPSSVEQALLNRRSIRAFRHEPLSLDELSQLAWSAQGVSSPRGYRTAPSAGALYPVETYVVANGIDGIPQGIYHYNVKKHCLETIKKGDMRPQIAKSALDQGTAYRAPAVFVFTVVFGRTLWKYNERGFRYIYMDTGHVGQALVTAATALGLGSCLIGALYDGEANQLLEVDGKSESVVYMCTVGYPK